ncbi:uncharacterized protein TNCV_1366731 [Trichonephila clavipes]|nr:uncharacterized protein TNCV_1366731 [Trichonephila clavipes]
MQNHRRLRRQRCDERRMWAAEWNEVVFTDESPICLQHHDGRIRVWRHRGERMLNSCVMHRHTGPASDIMETGKLEDRARAGRPCMKEARAPCIIVEMEAIAPEAASGTSSAREAARQLGLPPSSVPQYSSSNPPAVPIQIAIDPSSLKRRCPVNGWITETVNAQRYLMLLRETVVPCLIQRGQISNVTFMRDGATSHTANPVKAFLIQTFREDRIVSRRCRYPWPPRSPDLTPADFWLWGYLKSRVYLSGPSSLSELKDAIHREVSSIHPDMLHSAVAGFVTRLGCLLPCGGGHVEHILV